MTTPANQDSFSNLLARYQLAGITGLSPKHKKFAVKEIKQQRLLMQDTPQLTGLQKICKQFGSIKTTDANGKTIHYVWDEKQNKAIQKRKKK